MNEPDSSSRSGPGQGDAAKMTVLFETMVSQQANMALLFLGKVPHPEGGAPRQDLPAARFFIDQLEMLAVKTRGNLVSQEETMLQQTLTQLRLAFVEAANTAPSPAPSEPASAPAPEAKAERSPADTGPEGRKKFSKKYE